MSKPDTETVFSLRLPKQDAERLKHAARSRGVTISRVAREAIAVGLAQRERGELTYGCSNGAPLSIALVGIGLPETWTAGGLALEIDLAAIEGGQG